MINVSLSVPKIDILLRRPVKNFSFNKNIVVACWIEE